MDARPKQSLVASVGTTGRKSGSYITQMLRELRSQAEASDWQLAYMIEMAMLHSDQIDCGMVKAEVRTKTR